MPQMPPGEQLRTVAMQFDSSGIGATAVMDERTADARGDITTRKQ